MQPDTCLVKKLLPFINFHESAIRKSGVIGTIKNCCFETGKILIHLLIVIKKCCQYFKFSRLS